MAYDIRKMIVLSVLGVALLVGCGKTTPTVSRDAMNLQDLGDIAVCIREEGSGTRLAFEAMVTDSDNIENSSYEASGNDEVMSFVTANKNAIGYVSGGTASNVRGSYAVKTDTLLVRPFNLVYIGQLSELEKDFVRFIYSEGQTIVSKNYEPVKSATSFLSDRSQGTIKIGGSSSMADIMQELANEYMKINPNAAIAIVITDSGDGINGALNGTYDLGMVSRELTDYEQELLSTEKIAKDEIAVIVNEDNPITYLSIEELSHIFDGTITSWAELKEEN
ncbi:MAG: substrate-binding domain-containing protein [Lachnospiraceae bacterium]